MPREFHRSQRLSERIRRVLGELIRRELRDPRLGFVTVTDVEVSRDLSHAKVYFSVLDSSADLESTRVALAGAAGFLRSQLGRELVARNIPALRFVYDDTTERASKLESLIDEAVARDAAKDADQ